MVHIRGVELDKFNSFFLPNREEGGGGVQNSN